MIGAFEVSEWKKRWVDQMGFGGWSLCFIWSGSPLHCQRSFVLGIDSGLLAGWGCEASGKADLPPDYEDSGCRAEESNLLFRLYIHSLPNSF